MKFVELSDEDYAALENLAAGSRRTPDEVLASLIQVSATSAADPLAAFVLSTEFRVMSSHADKYLALLSWISVQHRMDFAEFIRSLDGGRRYVCLSREEILERCRHNQARQIDGTSFWAVMNLDGPTKRGFLARLLEFVGYRKDVIEIACAALGSRSTPVRNRFSRWVRSDAG